MPSDIQSARRCRQKFRVLPKHHILLRSGDRVIAAFAERIATDNSPQSHQSSARPTVFFQRVESVIRRIEEKSEFAVAKFLGKDASVEVEAYVKNLKEGQTLVYTIYDSEENELLRIETTEPKATFEIKDVHLWHGRRDPYLYCCEVEIVENGEVKLIDIQLLETPVEQQAGANKQEAYYRTAVRTAEGIEENYYTRYSETAETNPRRVSVFEKDGEGVEHETVLFTYRVG